jgi:hypothetical protein
VNLIDKNRIMNKQIDSKQAVSKPELYTVLSTGRLTKKKLIKWLNEQFLKFEIKAYNVYKVEQTRFRGQDYEGGACSLQIWFKPTDEEPNYQNSDYFMSFYRLAELENYAHKGARVHLKFNNKKTATLKNLEIEVSDT